MKIYTKKGDKGFTSLIGGVRVPKSSLRIKSYGTVDELNSYIGLVRDYSTLEEERALLFQIQNDLFNIGSLLAAHPEKNKMVLPDVEEAHILDLETAMDSMNEKLPPLMHFVLPGGHPTVSFCHIARTVCRRAERCVVELNDQENTVPIIIIQYLNRLSDYLFVLSRFLANQLGVEENKWIPKTTKSS